MATVNGMRLMRDTGSLMNAMMANAGGNPKPGDTFAELMWTDRELWVVTRTDGAKVYAKRAETRMEHWEDGYMYPVRDTDGNIKTEGSECELKRNRRGAWMMDGRRVHLSWGAKTGYRDPSF